MPGSETRLDLPARVLHVVGVMDRGGAEALIMNVYRAMDRRRVQFDFAVSTSRAGHYDEEIRRLGGRIFPHPTPAAVGLRRYRAAFRQTLERLGPFDAVHSHVHYFSGLVLETAHRAGIPRRIAHSHSVEDGQKDSMLRRGYRSGMRRLLLKYATHLLGCSPQACEALYGAHCWRDPRIQLVPNAIALEAFRGASRSGSLRRELALPEDAWLIGHVGNFTRAKNHEFLVTLFSALRRRAPDAHLVLVGDGPLRAEVEGSVRQAALGHAVHFLGTRADVPQLCAEWDAFVLPSLYEGFPVALVEAQAAGLPSVVSDSISPTVDLGLGLVRFVGLAAGVDAWLTALIETRTSARPTPESCYQVLKVAGHDAADVTKRLCETYV